MTKLKRLSLLVALVAVPVAARAVQEKPRATARTQERAIDPAADRLLRQMTEYVAGLRSFRVQSHAVDEVVLTSGQKIQVTSDSQVAVERPNKLRSDQVGAENGLEFWYDGKTMSLYCKPSNTYATARAPATLDATIDAARKQFKIEAPGADLLYSHPYDVLTEQVTSGRFIGRETVDGVAANHLAFVGDDVDWQIWIEDGPKPVPLRYVITTKTMKAQPQFTVRLSHWETQSQLPDSTFAFQPPAGAKRVEAFPTRCGGPQ
jgi:hypothetical protein